MTQAVLATAAIACGALLYFARKYNISSLRRTVIIILTILAPFSIFAYHNLGKLHWGQSINIYDTYHYYMNSKYFKELGYWYIYDATIVAADEENLSRIQRIETFRQQKTYSIVHKSQAYNSMNEWRDNFTDQRWEQFKRDLRFFEPRASTGVWRKMLHDKGYNPTPAWTLMGKTLSCIVPAREGLGLLILSCLDLIFIIVMIAGIWWAFGIETALLSAMFLGVNFTTPYSTIGGAFLRWDYCMWMMLSICAMKKGKPFVSGMFLIYATLLRISPFTFMFGVVVTAGWALVQSVIAGTKALCHTQKSVQLPHNETWRVGPFAQFFSATMADLKNRNAFHNGLTFAFGCAAAGVLILILSVLVVPGGAQNWKQWYQKMQMHQQSLGTKRYGLKYLFVYEGEITREDIGLAQGDWETYEKSKWNRLAKFKEMQNLVKALFFAWFVLAVFRKEQWEAMALGSLFIFVLLSPTRYYYAQLIALIPLLTYNWKNGGRLWGYCLLLLATIAAYFFYSFQEQLAFMQFVVSLSLLILYLYLLTWFTLEQPCPNGR